MASKLYLISPPQIELAKFIPQFQSALSGGEISLFQLRLKDTPPAEIITAAQEILPLCRERNIKFIINDSAEIAEQIDADGIHIGEEDDLGNYDRKKIIGVSCYNSLVRARAAADSGASYVSFGAFYPTQTKTPKARAEISLLKAWKTESKTPCSVIGGITPQNANSLIAAGADYICAISSVWQHKQSPAAAINEFNQLLSAAAS